MSKATHSTNTTSTSLATTAANAGVPDLLPLCRRMNEYEELCISVHQRLTDIPTTLDNLPDESVTNLIVDYGDLMKVFHEFLQGHIGLGALSRLWVYRKVVTKIRSFHEQIDGINDAINTARNAAFGAGGVIQHKGVPWQEKMQANIAAVDEQQLRAAKDERGIRAEVQRGSIEAPATMIRYEITYKSEENSREHLNVLKTAYATITELTNQTELPFQPWFRSSNDIDYEEKDFLDEGTFGRVYEGNLSDGSSVVVKVLLANGDHARQVFDKELAIWYPLKHSHISKLIGGCHLTSPLFFVSARAEKGNFAQYFFKHGKSQIWRLFHEVAQGLSYLHANKVIHGNLKCTNLLVRADGRAEIGDFGFSYTRSASVGLSAKTQTNEVRWKAPETMMQSDNPDALNPRWASDVYSLGMCIWEAFEGEYPFSTNDDDEVMAHLFDADFEMPAPKNIPEDQWQFVKQMLCHNWEQRVKLPEVLAKLKEYRDEESASGGGGEIDDLPAIEELHIADASASRTCPQCDTKLRGEVKFCSACGHKMDNNMESNSANSLNLFSRADVDYKSKDLISKGPQFILHRGTWYGMDVVIKQLLCSASDIDTRVAIERQANIWQRLDHPNIIKMHDVCFVGNQPIFVMEHATNGCFEEWFRKDKTQIWRLFYETALGLDYMHQHKVVHGDLNCRHLLVDSKMQAKISGFSCAFISTSDLSPQMTRSDMIRWKAPELLSRPGGFASLRTPVPASDVYSFGMCIWEAFAGHPPYDAEYHETIVEKILDENFTMPAPENLSETQWRVVLRMLDRNWRTRMGLQDVIAVLEYFKTEEATSTVELNSVSHTLFGTDTIVYASVNFIHSKLGNVYIPRDEVQFGEFFAEGSFGKIYRGIWNMLPVVIKCVDITSVNDKQAFFREIKVWRQARHRHILQFYGASDIGPQCFMVCEHAEGGTLTEYLQREREKESCKYCREMKPRPRNVWRNIHEAALGLFFLHKNNIVHGDLKGNNILVRKDGEVVLADFGLSFVESGTKPNVRNLGAIRWRAPEYVIHGIDGLSRAADVYSLGMCIVEAVTGNNPWFPLPESAVSFHLKRGKSLKQPSGMSDEAWQLVSGMCSWEPSDRTSLDDVLRVLDNFADAEELRIINQVNSDDSSTS